MSVNAFIRKNPDIKIFFDKILQCYPNLKNSYNNVLYLIRHNLDPDKVLFCKICHKPLKFIHGIGSKETPKYCSAKCASNDSECIEKRKETNLKKYGGTAALNSPILREKIKATNRERYGVDFPFQNQEIQNEAHTNLDYQKRNETTKKTLQEKYGPEITNISQVPEIKQKKKETLTINFGSVEAGYKHIFEGVSKTNLEKYGVDNVLKDSDFHQYSLEQSWENTVLAWSDYVTPLFSKDEWKGYYQGFIYKWKCELCQNEFEQKIYNTKHLAREGKLKRCPRCPHCFPINPHRSALEINVYNYIESIYDGELLHNRFDIIPPKEIDIYLPELKLAFEVDGTYWHSEKFHDESYHKWKDDECLKQGIKLVHILEEEWNKHQDEVKSEIKNLVNNSI